MAYLKFILLEERIVLDAAVAAVAVQPPHPNDVVVSHSEVNITQAAHSQAESTLLVNPTDHNNLVLAMTAGSGTGLNENIVWTSHNAGATWTMSTFVAPSRDTQAAFDQFGNLFVVTLESNVVGDGNFVNGGKIAVYLSTNEGTTFTHLSDVLVTGPNSLPDFPHMATGAGPIPGTNAVWIVADTVTLSGAPPQINAAYAETTGLGLVSSFQSEHVLTAALPTVVVGPSGQALVAGVGPVGEQLVALDPDGLGLTGFGAPVVVNAGAAKAISSPFDPLRNDSPAAFMAWDTGTDAHAGRVYITYTGPDTRSNYSNNVYVQYSDNNGATWSTPLNASPTDLPVGKIYSSISVDPSTGNVFVGWYDARNDLGNYGPGDTDGVPGTDMQYFGAISKDGGHSFLSAFQISNGTSSALSTDIADFQTWGLGFGYGDYTLSSYVDGQIYVAWADNSPELAHNPNQPTMDMAYKTILVPNVLTAVDSRYAIPVQGSTTLTVDASHGLLSTVADPNTADTIGGTLTASLYANPLHGSVTVNADGSFTYQPNNGFVGVDTFQFKVQNGSDSSIANAFIDTQQPQLNQNGHVVASYLQGGTPVALDSITSLTGTSGNLDGGKLIVYVSNSTGNDTLGIRTDSTIQVAGNTISYLGTAIGTFDGGLGIQSYLTSGSRELTINFNAAATAQMVAAVASHVTYSNIATTSLASTMGTIQRTVNFSFSDGDGAVSQTIQSQVNITPRSDNPSLVANNQIIALPAAVAGGVQLIGNGIHVVDPGIDPNSQLIVLIESTLPQSPGSAPQTILNLATDFPNLVLYSQSRMLNQGGQYAIKGTITEINHFLSRLAIFEPTANMPDYSVNMSVFDTSINGTFFDGSMMRAQTSFVIHFANNAPVAGIGVPPPSTTPYNTQDIAQLNPLSSASHIIYVNANSSGSVHDGSSWATAYTSLQDALANAASTQTRDQIWVAQGTYVPGAVANTTFNIPSGVAVYGGFLGNETLLSQRNIALHPTILSGEIGTASLNDNIHNIVTVNGAIAILDGLTIARGFDPTAGGSAIRDLNSTLSLRNMSLSGNSAGGFFGASTLLASGGNLSIDNSVIANNSGAKDIWALYVTNTTNSTITNSTFSGNRGAVADLLNTNISFLNDSFLNNVMGSTAYNGGPAIYARGDNGLTIRNSIFNGNITGSNSLGDGGGAMVLVSDNHVTIDQSQFNGNQSVNSGNGGAISLYYNRAALNPIAAGDINNSQIVITNTTFNQNQARFGARWGGGGIFSDNSNLALYKDTLSDNVGSSGGSLFLSSSTATMDNAIFNGNSAIIGGAMEIYQRNSVVIRNSQFNGNFGILGSGAIDTSETNVKIAIDHSQFNNNATDVGGQGGAIGIFEERNFSITNSSFNNNTTNGGLGDSIFISGSFGTLANNTYNGGAPTGNDVVTIASIVNNQVTSSPLLQQDQMEMIGQLLEAKGIGDQDAGNDFELV